MDGPIAVTVEVIAYSETDTLTLEGIGLQSTLDEVKKKILELKKLMGRVHIYFCEGREIRYAKTTTLEDIFGSLTAFGDDDDGGIKIELDFALPFAGKVQLRCEGPAGRADTVNVLDKEEKVVSLKVNAVKSTEVDLKRTKAYVNGGRARHNLMVIEKELDALDGKRQLVVREHCLLEEETVPKIAIDETGGYQVLVNGRAVDKRCTMIWLFEETREGSEEFVQSCRPALPSRGVDVERIEGIDRNMVTTALEVCHETYNDQPTSAREDINGTWCVLRVEGDALFIGFRGSEDTLDWLTNLNVDLQVSNELNDKNRWPDVVKLHRGFDLRSREILQQNFILRIEEELVNRPGRPKKIITCGHSLGGALSQIIHIMLHGEHKIPLRGTTISFDKFDLLNVTFATPMVGNHALREKLNESTLSDRMYHFVNAGDIIPALLFTRQLYQKLAYSDEQLEYILWLASFKLKEEGRERARTLNDDLSILRTEDQSAENTYAPIGKYFLLDENLYELPNNNTVYVAQAMIPGLKVLKDVTVGYQAWKWALKKVTLGWYDDTAASKIEDRHLLKNYHDKLAVVGMADRRGQAN